MSKIRTFIAVELSEDVREAAVLLADELRPAAGSLRWVAPENLHWTLQFLGDVEDADIPEVCRRVAEAAAALSSFRLSARGAGAFPHPGRPRTIWIGAGQGRAAR